MDRKNKDPEASAAAAALGRLGGLTKTPKRRAALRKATAAAAEKRKKARESKEKA